MPTETEAVKRAGAKYRVLGYLAAPASLLALLFLGSCAHAAGFGSLSETGFYRGGYVTEQGMTSGSWTGASGKLTGVSARMKAETGCSGDFKAKAWAGGTSYDSDVTWLSLDATADAVMFEFTDGPDLEDVTSIDIGVPVPNTTGHACWLGGAENWKNAWGYSSSNTWPGGAIYPYNLNGDAAFLAWDTPECGDGSYMWPEGCDDGDTADGDGCSASCEIESGWTCQGAFTSVCWEIDPTPPTPPVPQNVRATPYMPPHGGWMLLSSINAPSGSLLDDPDGYFSALTNVPALSTSLPDAEAWQAQVAEPGGESSPLCSDTGGLTNLTDRYKGLIFSPYVAGCDALVEGEQYRWRARARYGAENGYGPWSQWADWYAAPDSMAGRNGATWGISVPNNPPDCSLWGGLYLSGDEDDGLACAWTWTAWLLKPSPAGIGEIFRALVEQVASTRPLSYVLSPFEDFADGLGDADECDVPDIGVPNSDIEIKICDGTELAGDVFASDRVQNSVVGIGAFAVLTGLAALVVAMLMW